MNVPENSRTATQWSLEMEESWTTDTFHGNLIFSILVVDSRDLRDGENGMHVFLDSAEFRRISRARVYPGICMAIFKLYPPPSASTALPTGILPWSPLPLTKPGKSLPNEQNTDTDTDTDSDSDSDKK
ncbi:hypothetical protein EMPG_09920 [Blastomyces silverae]|uniref:Uncharacterized protein n=1 Tax=Blastomyces silverae TaxID=2060906 RepID=A0A0H1BL81_9EURO|nr:hypothetical protein EMPG_09920 [Blastomyces silverae]